MKTASIHVRMASAIHKQILEEAEKRGMTISSMVRIALKAKFGIGGVDKW